MKSDRTEEIIQKVKERMERDITLTLKAKEIVAIRRLLARVIHGDKTEEVDIDFYQSLDDSLYESLAKDIPWATKEKE